MVTAAQHDAALRSLADSFSRLDPTVPVRLAKGTTNLFRPRAPAMGPGLDVSTLTGVLDVDRIAAAAWRLGDQVTISRIEGGMHDLSLSQAEPRQRWFDAVSVWLSAYVPPTVH